MAEKLKTPYEGDPILKEEIIEGDFKTIINESFGGEEGILEIFKGVYKHAKGGSVPHAAFIMQWYFKGGEEGTEPKEYQVARRIIENEN